jgi:hypothetical protein
LRRPCRRFERHAQFGNRLAEYISQLLLACTAYRRNAEARRAPILVGSMAKDRFEDHRVEFVLGQRCARLRIALHGIEPRLEGLDVQAREIDNGFAQDAQPLGGEQVVGQRRGVDGQTQRLHFFFELSQRERGSLLRFDSGLEIDDTAGLVPEFMSPRCSFSMRWAVST